jgi:hypothetical protein
MLSTKDDQNPQSACPCCKALNISKRNNTLKCDHAEIKSRRSLETACYHSVENICLPAYHMKNAEIKIYTT